MAMPSKESAAPQASPRLRVRVLLSSSLEVFRSSAQDVMGQLDLAAADADADADALVVAVGREVAPDPAAGFLRLVEAQVGRARERGMACWVLVERTRDDRWDGLLKEGWPGRPARALFFDRKAFALTLLQLLSNWQTARPPQRGPAANPTQAGPESLSNALGNGRKRRAAPVGKARKPSSTTAAGLPAIRMEADAAIETPMADTLRYRDYADAIVGLINHEETKTPLVLAVNAPWGAGKSSLVNLVTGSLRAPMRETGRPPHVVCTFNAWMHDGDDSLTQAFLRRIAQEADRARPWWRRVLRPLPLHMVERMGRSRRLAGRLALGVLVAALLVGLPGMALTWSFGWSLPFALPDWLPAQLATGGASAAVAAAFLGVRRLMEVARKVDAYAQDPEREARAGSLHQVRGELQQLLREARRDPARRRAATRAPPRRGRSFVVVVDDLERCRPPHAVDVLETINQLLAHPGVVVVLLADMDTVAASVEVKYQDLARKVGGGVGAPRDAEQASRAFGRDYLQKIVQVQFDLPPLHPHRLATFLAAPDPKAPEAKEPSRPMGARLWLAVWLGPWRSLARAAGRAGPRTRAVAAGALVAALAALVALAVGVSAQIWAPPGTELAFSLAAATALVVPFILLQRLERRRGEAMAVARLDTAADLMHRALAKDAGATPLGAAVEQVGRALALNEEQARAVARRVLYRISLQSGGTLFEEAKAAGLPHLPPFPRSAKRFANRVRVHLYLCAVRGLLAPSGPATPAEVGRWCALQERWPDLGRALLRLPAAAAQLHQAAREPQGFGKRMQDLAPLHAGDEVLRVFLLDHPLPNAAAIAWLDQTPREATPDAAAAAPVAALA